MPHFVLTYALPTDYFERRGPFKEGHMQLIAKAAERGGLVIAGAIGMPLTSAAYIFDGEGAAEIFAQADPYVTGGVTTHWSVALWTPVVGPGAA
jgi:uncharacterized protein YciI